MTPKLSLMPKHKFYFPLLLAILLFFSQSANAEQRKLCDSQSKEIRIDPIEIGAVAVFGELHGTHESPDFIRQVICAELGHGRRVVVGLEANLGLAPDLPSTDRNAAQFSYEKFAGNPFWHRAAQSQDGRSSEAMWLLWTHLIARQLDAGDVVVVPSEPKGINPSIGKFVALMSEQTSTTGVILVGNYHARAGATNDLLQGLATLSRQAGRALLMRNYLMLYSAGSAWNCRAQCGTHRTSMPIVMTTLGKGAYLMADANSAGIAPYLAASIPQLSEYLGFYWVDTVTPSPPHNGG